MSTEPNKINTTPPTPMPNGFFKKQVFIFGLCFSWGITIFCLLFGESQNSIHSDLAIYSFIIGVAFIFALVFKGKLLIDTKFLKYEEGAKNDDHNTKHN